MIYEILSCLMQIADTIFFLRHFSFTETLISFFFVSRTDSVLQNHFTNLYWFSMYVSIMKLSVIFMVMVGWMFNERFTLFITIHPALNFHPLWGKRKYIWYPVCVTHQNRVQCSFLCKIILDTLTSIFTLCLCSQCQNW